MRQVSQAFLEAMVAPERQVTARVTIDYTDPEIDQSIEVSASDQGAISYPEQTADAVQHPAYKWASLDGSWVLDGTYHLIPDTPEDAARYQVGWWGATLAGAEGAFSAPYPTLTVTFLPRPVHSLKVVGDSARQEWPVDFVIRLYNEGALLHEEVVTGNTEVAWARPLEEPITSVTRMELEIRRWSHEGRVVKILEFFTSVQQTYLAGDILEISLIEEREVSQNTLPVGSISANEIKIRLSNEDRRFDADNAQSPLYELLKPNRRIRAWLGITGGSQGGQQVSRTWDTQADWQAGVMSVGLEATSTGDMRLAHVATNAILNPDMTGDSNGDGVADSWSKWGLVGTYTVRSDGQEFFVAGTAGAAGGPQQTNRLSVLAGDTVYISFQVKQATPGVNYLPNYLYLMYDAGGNASLTNYGANPAYYTDLGNGYKRFDLAYVVPRDGVVGILLGQDPRADSKDRHAIYRDVYLSKTAPVRSASWTSQSLDLTLVGRAATSKIAWTATTPPGTSVTVEASLDGGQTWTPCTNGGGIPGIEVGDDLTGKSLLVRAALSTTDTSVTPVLHSLTVQVNHEEWVPLGLFWSTEWQAEDDTVEASVVARDRLELLRKSTYQTSQVLQNTNLHDLAVLVLADAGLDPEEYWVDPALQQIRVPYAWFDPVSHREALRIIAEAGLAQVYCDRDGVVRVERQPAGGTPVLEITADDYYRLSNPMRPNQVANEVIVSTSPLRPADVPEEVYRSNEPITVPAGRTLTVTVYYQKTPVIDATASLDGAPAGVAITQATYYGWGAETTIQNTGGTDATVTLVVTGRPLSVQNRERAVARDEASIIEHGTLRFEFPDNPLVQSPGEAQEIADRVLASAKDARRDLEIDWRGNPALELGDVVKVKGRNYAVIRQEIRWAGALSAYTTGRRVS